MEINRRSNAVRRPRLLAIRVCFCDEVWTNALLRNVSTTGLSARLEFDAFVGQALWFDIPGLGLVDGKVRWVRGRNIGVCLSRSITMAEIKAPPPPTAELPAVLRPDYLENFARGRIDFRRPGFGHR